MSSQMSGWSERTVGFLKRNLTNKGSPSVPGGPITLYGTCYSLLGLDYLGNPVQITPEICHFVMETQDELSGLFVGPELAGFEAKPGAPHDRDHLLLHLTCAALPLLEQFNVKSRYPIYSAHRFCNRGWLKQWFNKIDLRQAWLEGNNILFVGQLLVYLRDVEKHPGAGDALKLWFAWLDAHVDPKTGLWGTNGYCSAMEAVYGGYHQLLVYYYDGHPLSNITGLVDTVLGLQHDDGGFNPRGNGGACEDVDSVDILVNCYKRLDYKRTEIRVALRRCMKHILEDQNEDGGFPYNRNQYQSHMGIPGTTAEPNVSCIFPTWFRIHTLALIAEILPNDPNLKGIPFKFNRKLGMGWHASPDGWIPVSDTVTFNERLLSAYKYFTKTIRIVGRLYREALKYAGKVIIKIATK